MNVKKHPKFDLENSSKIPSFYFIDMLPVVLPFKGVVSHQYYIAVNFDVDDEFIEKVKLKYKSDYRFKTANRYVHVRRLVMQNKIYSCFRVIAAFTVFYGENMFAEKDLEQKDDFDELSGLVHYGRIDKINDKQNEYMVSPRDKKVLDDFDQSFNEEKLNEFKKLIALSLLKKGYAKGGGNLEAKVLKRHVEVLFEIRNIPRSDVIKKFRNTMTVRKDNNDRLRSRYYSEKRPILNDILENKEKIRHVDVKIKKSFLHIKPIDLKRALSKLRHNHEEKIIYGHVKTDAKSNGCQTDECLADNSKKVRVIRRDLFRNGQNLTLLERRFHWGMKLLVVPSGVERDNDLIIKKFKCNVSKLKECFKKARNDFNALRLLND